MKKIIYVFIHTFLFLAITKAHAQIDFKDSTALLKFNQKSMYSRFYQKDSIISTSLDPNLDFPWQSQTFKKNAEVLDSLNTRIKVEKFQDGFYTSARFPKGTSEEDAEHYTYKIISYKLSNEKNEKVTLRVNKMYSLINNSYHYLDPPTRYIFWLRFIAEKPSQTFKGYVEYDIIAPAKFDSTIILKSDTGKTLLINNKQYIVLAFTKNYVALKPIVPLKSAAPYQEIGFKFIGTDSANNKFLPKFTQEKGYSTAILRNNLVLPEELFFYYTKDSTLSKEEISNFVEEYHKARAKNPAANENPILIIKDMGYIDKMICYWPTSTMQKRIKKIIDLK
jgi:hypothetical protein